MGECSRVSCAHILKRQDLTRAVETVAWLIAGRAMSLRGFGADALGGRFELDNHWRSGMGLYPFGPLCGRGVLMLYGILPTTTWRFFLWQILIYSTVFDCLEITPRSTREHQPSADSS